MFINYYKCLIGYVINFDSTIHCCSDDISASRKFNMTTEEYQDILRTFNGTNIVNEKKNRFTIFEKEDDVLSAVIYLKLIAS